MEATLATLAASVSGFAPLLGASPGLAPEALGPAGWLAAAAATGVLGITDILGDDEDDDAEDGGDDEDDDAEDGGDDLGGLDGGDDLGDLGDLDDEGLGGFDDESDGLESAGGDVSELENRLEELENEVASLSSSVNTVQNENEAMSETVGDVEENVRDLLEIYEMVTRGVNPFVDETASGAMGGGEGFGLFDDHEDEGGDVDDSITDADAEEFFDDDFDEPEDDEVADPDDAAVLDDDDRGGLDDDGLGGLEGDDLGGLDDDEGDADGGGDGKSFDELKEEYESGDAGWDDTLEGDDEAGDDEELPDGEDELLDDEGEDESPGDDEDDELLGGDGKLLDGDQGEDSLDGDQGEDSLGAGEDPDDEAEDTGDTAFEFVGEAKADDGTDDSRLQEFPEGYAATLTALEWVEYLIGVGGKSGARDALAYYADVGWISPEVEDEFHALLDGIDVSGPDGDRPDPGSLAQFDPGDHRRSLVYVARLSGDGGDRVTVLDRVGPGPGPDRPDAAPRTGSPVADGGESGVHDGNGGSDDGV
ncbi:MAG: FlaD/FlaE family flagellar protein [Halobacteriales archaeon]